tara:strand:- start:36 stop:620 length:585 start_codon:yes stop_codon:yes gene_type:complete
MKNFFILFILLFILACNKQKTVLICGDHICVNKKEAKQYFEENLTLEVKIFNNEKKEDVDLVQLNLNKNFEKRNISIKKKRHTNQKLKNLTNEEVKVIKSQIKKKEMEKRLTNKSFKKDNNKKLKVKVPDNKKNSKIVKSKPKKKAQSIISSKQEIVDVCTIIEKCSIEEISKYLIKKGKNKSYPDLTVREKNL